MARIRSIKPEFWSDPVIGTLPVEARLFYIALWNFADDEGRGRAIPKELAGFAFPHDEDMGSREVREILARLRAAGRIVLYEADGEALFQVVHWSEHQKPDHPTKSRYQGPPPGEAAHIEHAREILAKPPEELGGRNQEVGIGNQEVGSRRERGGAQKPAPAAPSKFQPPSFEEIKEYFLEKGSSIREAEKFHAHYESNGWKVGRTPMKLWRGAASGWILRQENFEERRNGHAKGATGMTPEEMKAESLRNLERAGNG